MQPGCYLMKDAGGQVLYVGKAKNLRRRLASYFRRHRKPSRTQRLVDRIHDVEIILVNNETESLILENNLIKRYKPCFNRLLVDDDSGYAYIAVTDEVVPRLVPYRKHRVNKDLQGTTQIARRFGPYVNSRYRDTLLAYVCESFQLKTCRQMPKRACLSYHLGRCSGICEDRISSEAYAAAVDRAVAFLASYQHTALLRQMKTRMARCAERLAFEKAGKIRDQITALESVLRKQIVERDVRYDQDVLHFSHGSVLVMTLKRGAVQSLRLFDLDQSQERAAFLISQYTQNSPQELIVNQLQGAEKIAEQLTAANGHSVRLTLPRRGVKAELLKLCARNHDYRVSR